MKLSSTIAVIGSAIFLWSMICVCIGVLAVVLAGGYVKSPFEAVPWMLRVSLIPTMIAGFLLSRLPLRFISTTARRHLTSAVTAYFTLVLIGSVFTVIDGTIRFGGVNAWGYFTWSWIYAALFLPISYPICLILLRVRKFFEKQEGTTEPCH